MKIPNLHLTDLTTVISGAWPFLAAGVAALTAVLLAVAYLSRRGTRKKKMSLENKLTFIVAVIIAGVCAQGMGRFFYDKLDFPIALVIVVGGVLELTAFTCALRARRNILDPDIGSAGVDGAAVWVVTTLSGVFSAMDADSTEVAIFRLIMPLLAAWLWERGMSIERRKVRGGSTLNLRLTPERVLVWLRLAEPSERTASEVDADRRISKVAKAAWKVRSRRDAEDGSKRLLERAEKKMQRATLSAVVHANLAKDPKRKEELLSQISFIFNALSLADLKPESPWSEVTPPPSGGDLKQVTESPSGHRALEAPAERQVTSRSSVPDSGQVTPEALTQATPRGAGQVTHQDASQVTPGAESPTPKATQTESPAAPQGRGGAKSRRTDDELKTELDRLVAEHYRHNPGVEINVKPVAKQLGIGRDRCRRLLAEMSVRPIRKAANQ